MRAIDLGKVLHLNPELRNQTKKMKPSPTSTISFLCSAIDQLPGLSAKDCQNLKDHSITTTLALLQKAGSSRPQKEALAIDLGIKFQLLNKWLVFADLARIPAVGCQHCGLIVHSGICSIEQLAQTPLGQLHKQIMKFQVQNLRRADLCPSLEEMSIWIEQAQLLQPKIKAKIDAESAKLRNQMK